MALPQRSAPVCLYLHGRQATSDKQPTAHGARDFALHGTRNTEQGAGRGGGGACTELSAIYPPLRTDRRA
jgi:hypothetical protein